jgi:hypothetical protein
VQSGSSFDHFAQFMEELEPRVERYSQTECLLARRSLSPFQLLCDFTCGSLLPSKCLQGSHIFGRP